MKLQKRERDYYVVEIETIPALAGVWEASFDNGTAWATGSDTVDGWAWLVAGPLYVAGDVGQNPAATQATITAYTKPLLRIKDDPILDVEYGPEIFLV